MLSFASWIVWVACIVCGASGCGSWAEDTSATATATARVAAQQTVPIGDQEDAVCGMMVREQTAPRAQVVHRDGTRLFFCSLGDMLVHLGAPSPHGHAQTIFVEVMKPEEDPMQSHTEPHPWLPAERAIYVVGIERQRIMGKPVLAYESRSDAQRAIRGHPAARILDLAELRAWWNTLSR